MPSTYSSGLDSTLLSTCFDHFSELNSNGNGQQQSTMHAFLVEQSMDSVVNG
jgi:hypothetical protein